MLPAKLAGVLGGEHDRAASARSACTALRVMPLRASVMAMPVLRSARRALAAVVAGEACASSATMPETYGADAEVPKNPPVS